MAVLPFDVFWRDHGAKAGLKGLSTESKNAAKDQAEFRRQAVAAGAIVGAALFELGRRAVTVASDIGESQSKVNVVFGKSASVVEDLGERSAKSLGISKAAALEAAGTFGNLFVSLKLPQGEAAKMSTRMIELAADMASFNNASPEEALEALRSGLVGEAEPLRRFGVNLNDATLRTKALELGLVKSTKDALDPATKAQATYALVLEQTTTAQGDFARTSGGLANSQRILKAEFTDLQGELGQKLLPAAVEVTHVLVGLVEFLDQHGKSVGIVAGSFAAVAGGVWAVNKAAAGIKATTDAFDHLTTAVQSFSKEGGKGRAALGSLGGFLTGPWGAALLVGGAALAVWAKHQADARKRVEDLRNAIDQQTGAITDNARQLAYANLVESGAVQSAKNLGVSLEDLTDAALGNAGAQERVAAALALARAEMGSTAGVTVRGATSLDSYRTNIDRVEDAVGRQNTELQKAREGLRDASAAGVVATDTTEDLTGATVDNTAALADNVEKLSKREQILNRRDAQRNYEQAVDDLSAALKENGKTLDNGTEKGRKNNEAMDRLAEAAVDYKKAIRDAKGSTAEMNRVQADAYKRLYDTMYALTGSKKKADAYARSVLGIPDKKTTKITTDKRAADAALNSFERRLARLHGKTVTVGARLSFPQDWAQYRAGERKAYGGPIGDGVGVVDEVPVLAMRGEHMWTTRETAAVGGHGPMMRLRRAALRGELRGYAAGGPIGSSSPAYARWGVGQLESNLEYLAVKFGKDLQSQLGAMGGGALGGAGWARQWAALHAAFPSAQLFSSYRPGAVTASGNASWHSRGRAIDVTPSMDIFRWIARNYGAATKELIFSTAGTDQIKNGRRHWYGEPVRSMHWNHVHWAYDRGGMANGPGWIPKGPRPERVLSPAQTASFERLVRVLDGGGGAGTVIVHASFPNYLGTKAELRSALAEMADRGTLRRYTGRG